MPRLDGIFHLDNETALYGGKAALAGITLKINRGEKVAVVGESGAGKSTLLRLLRTQQPAQIAWCPQADSSGAGLVPVLSAFHNVYMGRLDRHSAFYNLRNLLWPVRSEVVAVERVLSQLGMEEWLWKSVDRLSGGQQQRVAVARALFAGRPAFLGDEPVSAVDGYQARETVQLITATHETVVLALHDIGLALSCCDRIIGLQDGRIALDARAATLAPQDLAPLYRHGRLPEDAHA